ncbi:MAG: GAF domain-containing sensor histidine kinase [Anaerolineae bacterium]|nr:GAF domain-containing sensor histidine kinase [Anaerolineae bacterium]
MTSFTARASYLVLGICFLLCVGWHLVLLQIPTDAMTGTATVQGDQYVLRYFAVPGTKAADDGSSTYKYILRVDSHAVSEWLDRAVRPDQVWESSWQVGTRHQYLVERRDGDGKRVITVSLTVPPPNLLPQYLGLAALVTLATVIAALTVSAQRPRLAIAVPITLLACGGMLNLTWSTFAVPFSYIALSTPLLLQLAFHTAASVLLIGAVVHIALVFPAPLSWYTRHRRVVLAAIYGLFPLGLALIIALNTSTADKITGGLWWEQQATVALKALSYLIWAAQYRKATVRQRGQLHWLLMTTTAVDLMYMAYIFSDGSSLIIPYQWVSLLLPFGYIMATLPTPSLRLSLEATSGFVHGMANTLTLALFLCGLGLAANVLIVAGNQTALPLTTMLLSIIFALTTIPLANALRDQFDSWLHGTRSAQRLLLHQFTRNIGDSITLPEVTRAFQEALEEGVQPIDMRLWLWNDEAQALQVVGSPHGTEQFTAIDRVLYDDLLKLHTFTPAAQFTHWSDAQRYHGLISLVSSQKLVGVCAIGARIDGRRYSEDTLNFFETLTRSATLALRNAQLVSQLEDNIATLRHAYQQLITVQENERQRLATELHDETLQQLAHANLLAGGLQPALAEAARPSLKELQSMLVLTERHLREILRGIHPAVLTDLGLIPALNSWLPRPPGITVKLIATGFEDYRLPDPMLELTLYRLSQESVNNALKHANAHCIDIRLKHEANTITLEVIDDGAGFEPTLLAAKGRAASGHFGLMNLRERVRALNGQLVIESKPQQGTNIRAILPIENQ